VALQDAGFGSSPILRRHLGDGAGTSSSEPGKLFEPALLKPHVFGFDAITLQVRWAVPTGGRAALEVAYGRVITHVTSAYPPDHVEARDAKSGALLWQTAVFTAPEDRFVRGGRVHASPTRIYLLASERIVVIDARTGERLATLR
jgi:hypothetical protein